MQHLPEAPIHFWNPYGKQLSAIFDSGNNYFIFLKMDFEGAHGRLSGGKRFVKKICFIITQTL